jgi:hypothetical protein
MKLNEVVETVYSGKPGSEIQALADYTQGGLANDPRPIRPENYTALTEVTSAANCHRIAFLTITGAASSGHSTNLEQH